MSAAIQTVITVLEDQFPQVEMVRPGMRLVDDLGANSLDKLEIAMNIEDMLDISLTDKADVVNDLATVQDLIDLVGRALDEKAAA